INPPGGGNLTNTISVIGNEYDPDPSNNSATQTTAVLESVQLGAATYSAGEAAGVFSVTVTRSGAGAISVGYATDDNTATAGSDYTATSGTVFFAAGGAFEDHNPSDYERHDAGRQRGVQPEIERAGRRVDREERQGLVDHSRGRHLHASDPECQRRRLCGGRGDRLEDHRRVAYGRHGRYGHRELGGRLQYGHPRNRLHGGGRRPDLRTRGDQSILYRRYH